MLRTIHSKIAKSISRIEIPTQIDFNCSLQSESYNLRIYPLLIPKAFTYFPAITNEISHNLCLLIAQSVCQETIFFQQDVGIIESIINPSTDQEIFEYLPSFVTDNLLPNSTETSGIYISIATPTTYEQDITIFKNAIQILDLTDDMIFEESKTSRNLFSPLGYCRTDGKSYASINKVGQTELFERENTKDEKVTKIRKAYKREKSRKSEHIIRANIWDLLYPLLLPPLKYDFSDNFDLYQELYPYQKDGINFLFNRESALLADQMGTGKTVQSIIALRLLFRKGKIKNALIICPVAIIGSAQLSILTGKPEGWDGHLYYWAPELAVTVVRGNQEVREYDWSSPAHVYICTYDTLRNDIKNNLLSEEVFDNFDCIVLDEAQNIKNSHSGRARAIKKINAEWRWALTGTPIENKIQDIISIFAYIKPGLFKKQKDYEANDVRKNISPYFLRRLKKDVLKELPEKIRQEEWLELDGDQRTHYDKILTAGRTELKSTLETNSEFRIRRHIFALLNKLKQVCNFAPSKSTSPKTEAMQELLEVIKENNEKVIIFSQYKDFGLYKIEQFLGRRKIGYCTYTGGMSDKERNTTINKFRKDSSISVLLASVRAAGTGLTLTEASYVIHFDHWWNPAVMWQAEDRTHRPGQTKNVNVISFWVQGTIEERIKQKLKEKGLLIENVIDSLATSASDANNLISTEEWLDIFDIKVQSGKYKSKSTRSIEETLEKLKTLTPLEFENITKDYFIRLGYKNAKVTQKSYDGGIDVYGSIVKDGKTETIIAQCKRTENVGVKVARELLGVLASSKSVDKGYLITSGTFSSECINFANTSSRLVLINGLLFAKRINELEIIN